MRTIGKAATLAAFCITSAVAADAMSRKPGLWEVKTSIEGSNAPARLVRQCIDAETDRMLQSSAGPFDPAACKEQTVRRSAGTTTTDFACSIAGKPATARSIVSGNLDSAYTMTVTAESPALPGGRMVMSVDAKWLGPCAADQRPGDIVMSGGKTMNILDMRKQLPPPQAPH